MAAERSALGLAAIATVAVVAAYLARPFPLALAVDQVIGDHVSGGFDLTAADWRLLLALAGGVLVIALVNALGSHLAEDKLEDAAERIVHRLRVDTYARLQRLSLAYHERHHTGDLVTRVTGDVNAVGSLFSDSLGGLAQAGMLLAGMLIVSLLIDPLLALTAFAAAPAAALDRERRAAVAAADAHLGAVVGDREIALLDRRRPMAIEVAGRLGDEELALDLDGAAR